MTRNRKDKNKSLTEVQHNDRPTTAKQLGEAAETLNIELCVGGRLHKPGHMNQANAIATFCKASTARKCHL